MDENYLNDLYNEIKSNPRFNFSLDQDTFSNKMLNDTNYRDKVYKNINSFSNNPKFKVDPKTFYNKVLESSKKKSQSEIGSQATQRGSGSENAQFGNQEEGDFGFSNVKKQLDKQIGVDQYDESSQRKAPLKDVEAWQDESLLPSTRLQKYYEKNQPDFQDQLSAEEYSKLSDDERADYNLAGWNKVIKNKAPQELTKLVELEQKGLYDNPKLSQSEKNKYKNRIESERKLNKINSAEELAGYEDANLLMNYYDDNIEKIKSDSSYTSKLEAVSKFKKELEKKYGPGFDVTQLSKEDADLYMQMSNLVVSSEDQILNDYINALRKDPKYAEIVGKYDEYSNVLNSIPDSEKYTFIDNNGILRKGIKEGTKNIYTVSEDVKGGDRIAVNDIKSSRYSNQEIAEKERFIRDLEDEAIKFRSKSKKLGVPQVKYNKPFDSYFKDVQPVYQELDDIYGKLETIKSDVSSGKITDVAKAQEEFNKLVDQFRQKEQSAKTIRESYNISEDDLRSYNNLLDEEAEKYNLQQSNFRKRPLLEETDYSAKLKSEKRYAEMQEGNTMATALIAIENFGYSAANQLVFESLKSFKPIGESMNMGQEDYDWSDKLYDYISATQKASFANLGYKKPQDITGQDMPLYTDYQSDLPGLFDSKEEAPLPLSAGIMLNLANGLGSAAAFMAPVGIASKTIKGAGMASKIGRQVLSKGSWFLQMESANYERNLNAGMSPDDASELSILQTIQDIAAESVFNEAAIFTKARPAGFMSVLKAGGSKREALKAGLRWAAASGKDVAESAVKESFEEGMGQFSQDLGATEANLLYNTGLDKFNDVFKAKSYANSMAVGALTGGFLSGTRAFQPMSPTTMNAMSFMGTNAKEILDQLAVLQNKGEIDQKKYDLIKSQLESLSKSSEVAQNTPGFNELSNSDQDALIATIHQRNQLSQNIKDIGFETKQAKSMMNVFNQRIQNIIEGKKSTDEGSPIFRTYMDANLANMGVAVVDINDDGSFNLMTAPGLSEQERNDIKTEATKYLSDKIKNDAIVAAKFKPKQNAVQESSTEEVLPREQGETTETRGEPQGMGQSVQGEEVAQEGNEKSKIAILPELQNNPELIEQKRKETQSQIERTDLFDGVGEFSSELGGSDKSAVPVNRQKINNIEFVQYAHPETGSVDVIVTGTSDNDFVGFYRIYENGKPTNKWSSKFENQSRNKENFKTMISNAQDMLPEGHEYIEKTSISTDGLRIWNQQLNRGYELQYDENGKLITNLVAINGDAIVNELGIPVNKGNFDNIRVKNKEDFEKVKKALLPYLEKFGLNESDIKWLTGTVKINLPVLKKSSKETEAQRQENINKEASAFPVVEEVEAQMEKGEFLNDEKSTEAQDKLYEILGDIDSREDLTPEQKQRMSAVIENRIQKIQDYDYRTRTETRTTTQTVATGVSPKTQKQNERAAIPVRTVAEEGVDVTYDGRRGKVELRNGEYVFIPAKTGAVQGKPITIGEAAQVNSGSRFAGVENPTKGPNAVVANITLPNGSTLQVLNDDLSVDIGLEIAKQEIGAAPQALFDTVFEEVVIENKVEVPYLRETKPAQEQAATIHQATEQVTEQVTEQAQEEKINYTGRGEQDRALIQKYKGDNLKTKILDRASRIASALDYDTKIYFHETTEEYNKAIADRLGEEQKESTNGRFLYGDGVSEIHIDLSKANEKTLPHEAVHAVLYKAFGENEKLFQQFKDKLKPLLANSTVAELENFANQETYVKQGVTAEEFLAELGGAMTAAGNRIPKTTLQKITQLLNEFLSKITGGRIAPISTGEVIDLFNSMANAFTSGQSIQSLMDSKGLVGSGQINGSVKSKQSINTKLPEQQERTSNFSKVKEIKLSDLNDKTGVLTGSDRLTTAVLKFPDGSNMTLKGGIFYPSETGLVWASTDISGATKLANKINKVIEQQGEAWLFPVNNSYGSQYSNYTFFEVGMKYLQYAVKTKAVTKDEIINKINQFKNRKNYLKAFKKGYTPKVFTQSLANKNLQQIYDLIHEDFIPENATYDGRKEFVKTFFGGKDTKSRVFKNVPNTSELIAMTTEPVNADVRDFTTSSVIKITSKVTPKETSKENDGELFHSSYPAIIESSGNVESYVLDGTYNIEEVFPEFKKADGKVVNWKSVKEKIAETGKKATYKNYKNTIISSQGSIPRAAKIKSKSQASNLVEKAGISSNMTEDDHGNYLFYHYSPNKISSIDPRYFGRNVNRTGRDERPGMNISMYYTNPEVKDVSGDFGYVVRIPKDKVYPFNKDPLDLYDKAKAAFNKKFPGQAFDPNKQVAFISAEAAKLGYPMTVAKWGDNLRAQTTEKMVGEVYTKPAKGGGIDINEDIAQFKVNKKARRSKLKSKAQIEVDPKQIQANSEDKLNEVVNGDPEGGATFNLDGTTYNDGGLVIPITSVNIDTDKISPKDISDMVEDNIDKIFDDQKVKTGIYKFTDGKQMSVDLNIIVPSEKVEFAKEFARAAGQESIFSLDTYENIKTGSTGENPVSFSADEFLEIAEALNEGRLPNIERLEYKPEFKSKSQVSAIPKASSESKSVMSDLEMASNKTGLAKENAVKRFIEKYGEKGVVAKQISDNFDKIQEQLGITKICNI